MKKVLTLVLALIFVLGLLGCSSTKLVEGSEKTYHGTVTDRAMSVVNEGDREGRAYIIISCDDETVMNFWFAEGCESDAAVGDHVTIESAVEEKTNLLVAASITVDK